MPDRPLFRQFVVLYVTLGLVVLIQSVETAVGAVRGTIPPVDQHHALILGTLETIAAVLFLVPRTMRLGADLLLVRVRTGHCFGVRRRRCLRRQNPDAKDSPHQEE